MFIHIVWFFPGGHRDPPLQVLISTLYSLGSSGTPTPTFSLISVGAKFVGDGVLDVPHFTSTYMYHS